MPSNYTQNYKLNQWSKDDRVLMDDFNTDNAKIDGALKAEADARAAEAEARRSADAVLQAALDSHSAAFSKVGNCQIYTRTYTGTGTYGASNAKSLSFSYPPKLVAIIGPNGVFYLMAQGSPAAVFPNSSPPPCRAYLTWSGNSVSWYGEYAEGHMNIKSETYYVVALCQKD